MPNFADCLRVRESVELLGVSPSTIRNWIRAGTLIAGRQSLNDSHRFVHRDLEDPERSLGGKEEKAR